MFTAPSDKIKLSVTDTPGYTHAEGLTEDSASLASELLTINHNLYHTRWWALNEFPPFRALSDQVPQECWIP